MLLIVEYAKVRKKHHKKCVFFNNLLFIHRHPPRLKQAEIAEINLA